jgi:methyltransferase (TIGR00027 family)
MIEGQPSATALRTAMRRAAHQLLDSPLVFEDPLAVTIIGGDRGSEVARTELSRAESPTGSALRYFVAARSRYADERLALAVERGVRQAIVLGAGLDTLAYRNPFAAEGLVVYEVDHPATQAWKHQRLAETGIGIPTGVRFVAVDFARDRIDERLAEAGLDPAESAFFTWLGVVPYLTEAVVMSTLGGIAARAGESEIVFDFAEPPGGFSRLQRLAFDKLARRVAGLGEPFLTFFRQDDLEARLRALGYSEIEILAGPDLGARYLQGASPLDRTGIGHVASARRA